MNPIASLPALRALVRFGQRIFRPGTSVLVASAFAAFASEASAQAPPQVSMMPSYSQSQTYGNAAINKPIQVWGRVSGGSGSYGAYTLDFGDGTAVLSGTVNNAAGAFAVGGKDFLGADHTYTSGGSKTVTLTVTDNNGMTTSRSAVIRVLVNPLHSDKVNMAIEKGLVYLYRHQVRYGTPVRSYWHSNADEYGNGSSGAAVMAFAENGHLATNDPVADIYTETVKRGMYHVVSLGRNVNIGNQPDGNPDTNGNGRGINFTPNYVVYDHSFMLMAVINAFPDAATAQAAAIPAGLWVGGGATPSNFYDFVVDGLDTFYWCQADSGLKGWYYATNHPSQGIDGSTHQWPGIAILSAKERWGIVPPAWVVTNSSDSFVGLQFLSPGNDLDGSVGYSNNQSWRNSGKTGGALMGFYLGGKLVGSDDNANRARDFLARNWFSNAVTSSGADFGGWDGEPYAMFAMKKGLTLQGVTTVTPPDGLARDWYQDMSAWLLGDEALLDSVSAPPVAPPASPASIDSLRFETLSTCYTGTYQFFLNGVSMGSVNGNPTNGCTCSPGLVSLSVNPALLSNWNAAGNNTISFTLNGDLLVSFVRAVITAGTTTTQAYLYKEGDGSLNLCSGYQYLSNYTGSNNDLFNPTPTNSNAFKIGAGRRTISRAFGQNTDGSWNTSEWPISSGGADLTTSHAVLILTKSVTIPLPVAVAASVPDQSSRFPAAFTLDGSGSYHQSANSTIVEYLWDLDASDGLDWNNPGVTGRITSANPGWSTPGNRTVTLRVKDDATTPNYATTTTVVRVVDTDVAPVAVPIPASQLPAVYTGKIGDTISLDGSESYDPEGDPITAYAWDLDGNGTFGDAADAAKDTSGNGAVGVTASLLYTAEYNGQIGLRVTSTPPGGNPKSSTNNTVIDVQAATSDLYVGSIFASNVVIGTSANIQVVLVSDPASGKDATNVVVRFYDGNPLTTGNVIGSSVTVTVPKGGSVPVNVTGLPLTSGQQVVWVYVDATNIFPEFNEGNNTASVNVANKPPVAVAKNVTVSAGADCSAAASIDDGSSDPDAGDTITLTQAPAGPYPIGTTQVTLTVTDSKGLASSATAEVTVIDDTRPVINGCPENIVINTGAERTTCDQLVSWTPPTATDCSPVTMQATHAPGDSFPVGATMVTYSATDSENNTSTCSFTVTVVDTTPPLVPVLADVTGECSATIADAPTTTDGCAGTITGTTTDSLTRTTQGTSMVTWLFSDGSGNVVTATQNIIVKDTTAPEIPVLADVTGECSATIPAAPTTTDNCAGVITGTTDDELTYSQQGTAVVTWTFDDGHGNVVTATQNIIVNDTTAPEIPVLADVTGECSATIPAAPTTNDECAGILTGTTPDSLTRTEQGTSVVTWTFDDGHGNVVTATQNIVVKDTTPPEIPVLADVTGECSATIPAAPTTTDACAGVITGTTADSLTRTEQGTSVVTWSFDDGHGNVVTATQNIVVKDTMPPEAPVLADVTGECSATVPAAPTTTDECAGVITGTTGDSLTRTEQGTSVVTWSFHDGNGNVVTATQNIVVKDITPPETPVLADATGQCSAAIPAAPTTNDNCAGVITGTTNDSLSRTTQGISVVTWTFDDGHGNVTTAQQRIVVRDTIAPADPVLADATGQCSATIAAAPTTADGCAGVITGTTTDSLTRSTQGTSVVTWTFDDGNGNVVTAQQKIIVKDTIAPVIPVLADVTGQCSATIATAPTTTDNCSGTLTGTTTDSLTRTTQGTSVVTWKFDDGNGNVVTAQQNIVVKDTIAPVITCAVPKSVAFGAVPAAATTKAGFIAQGGTVSDNCDANPAVRSADVVTGLCPTIVTRTYTVTDASGNASTCVQEITVNNLFAGDGIMWHQPLARNGMSDDTDPGAGGTLKYMFKAGSTIPIQVHSQGCSSDVTNNSNVIGKVVVFGDTDMDGVIDAGELPIDYNGVGEAGGVMDKVGGKLKFNLDTKKLPKTAKCYILQVTITDNSTGESRVETVPLQAK